VNFSAKIKENITDIKSSRFCSLLIDGSADESTTEQHTYAKNLKDGEVKELLLGIAVLNGTTWEAYLTAKEDELNDLGLNWKDNQCLAELGIDGAPSMTGSINGLATRLRNVVKL
jgi:hypothetical protein